MNKQGFAVTGILYTLLLIGIISLNLLLFNLLNRKNLLDQIKTDTVNAVEKDSDFEYLLEQIKEIKSSSITIDKVYPIGSIYITRSNVNPDTMFEGTKWERYGVGKTLVSTDHDSDQIGGSNTATLAIANLPSHTHTMTPSGTISSTFTGSSVSTSDSGEHSHRLPQFALSTTNNAAISQSYVASGPPLISGFISSTNKGGNHSHTVTASGTVSSTFTGNTSTTSGVGNGQAFSVQNPYITVYMWKRVS